MRTYGQHVEVYLTGRLLSLPHMKKRIQLLSLANVALISQAKYRPRVVIAVQTV